MTLDTVKIDCSDHRNSTRYLVMQQVNMVFERAGRLFVPIMNSDLLSNCSHWLHYLNSVWECK